MVALVSAGTIDIVQLHGSEDTAYIARLRQLLRAAHGDPALGEPAPVGASEPAGGPALAAPAAVTIGASSRGSVEIWQAFTLRTAADLERACASSADVILLDNGKGTGASFDHGLLADALSGVHELLDARRWVLAGGLDPDNIPAAIARFGPWYLDVSSGVETDGLKDPVKMKRAVEAAHGGATMETGKDNSAFAATTSRADGKLSPRFGIHGGQYITETLMNAVIELEEAYLRFRDDPEFNRELTALLNDYAGRPSRLYYAKRMTEDLGGAKIYLKREDLNHTGAHKINNALGQALLAKKMGKTRLIAETGAGQHGVATATAAALLDMECVVYMGEEDTRRQALNVYRMKLLGADVVPVTSGTATLKDAVSEAMREWTKRIDDTHYCLGSFMGPILSRHVVTSSGYLARDQSSSGEEGAGPFPTL